MKFNTLGSEFSSDNNMHVEQIVSRLNLKNFRIRYIENPPAYQFLQDRRVVTVPKDLVSQNKWSDIRHLFRAILEHGPAVSNHGADNDWGPSADAYGLKSPASRKA